MPTERGDSWFSPKCIEVQPRRECPGGRALDGLGAKCQDVGLEAAIIERVRNSSLVECAGTDNVTRLKHRTEAVDPCWQQQGW